MLVGVDVIFRMWHQAKNVSLWVANAGNIQQ
jgi:hypothetical protein